MSFPRDFSPSFPLTFFLPLRFQGLITPTPSALHRGKAFQPQREPPQTPTAPSTVAPNATSAQPQQHYTLFVHLMFTLIKYPTKKEKEQGQELRQVAGGRSGRVRELEGPDISTFKRNNKGKQKLVFANLEETKKALRLCILLLLLVLFISIKQGNRNSRGKAHSEPYCWIHRAPCILCHFKHRVHKGAVGHASGSGLSYRAQEAHPITPRYILGARFLRAYLWQGLISVKRQTSPFGMRMW